MALLSTNVVVILHSKLKFSLDIKLQTKFNNSSDDDLFLYYSYTAVSLVGSLLQNPLPYAQYVSTLM